MTPVTENTTASIRNFYIKKNQYYHDKILQICQHHVFNGAKVLEIGCGTGNLIGRLERCSLKTGIDIHPSFIEAASEDYPGTEFAAGDAHHFSIERYLSAFDLIILSDTLAYLADVEEVLKNIRKFLAPHGKLFLTQTSSLWEPIYHLGSRFNLRSPIQPANWLSPSDIDNLLRITGYERVKSEFELLLPVKIPFLSYFFNRFVAKLWLIRHFCILRYHIARSLANGNNPSSPSVSQRAVSIVVPARNEAGNIKRIITDLPEMGSKTEIIFVEGHSSDNTWEVLKEAYEQHKQTRTIRMAQQEGKGKADAIRKGFSLAQGDILMIFDADLTVPPSELSKFYNLIASGMADFVVGNRLVYPMEKQAMRFLNKLGNKLFGFLLSFIIGQPCRDTLCGVKALWREDYERMTAHRVLPIDFDPFGDFDLLFGAAKSNLKILEIPVHYKARTYGRTNISRFQDGWRLLKMCWVAAMKIKFYG